MRPARATRSSPGGRRETKFRAVVFDLFGTLTEHAPQHEWNQAREAMARALGIPDERFAPLWSETYYQRSAGGFLTTEAALEHIAETLGVSLDPPLVEAAAKLRLGVARRALKLRPHAEETLARLRALGYKIGMISNCTSEVPALWAETPLPALIDYPVFSCLVGGLKPERFLYDRACDGLRVQARECLYLGDGESQELQGALEAGMEAVRIRGLYGDPDGLTWEGPVIESLREILDLVTPASATC